MRLAWILGAVALSAALAACGTAKPRTAPRIAAPVGALTYLQDGDAVLAKLGGGAARVLGPAKAALMAPNGTAVITLTVGDGNATLTLYRTQRRRVLSRVVAVLAPPAYSTHAIALLAWSPDSRYLLLRANALSSLGESGALLELDTTSGQIESIARGTLLGASFAPTLPDRIVYARASIVQLDDNEASLWTARVDGTRRRQLTRGGLASWPLWTRSGIYFAALERLGTKTASPLYGLWRIQPDGSGREQLTGVSGGPPAAPLVASASGRRIAANLASTSGGPVEIWAVQLTRRGWIAGQLSLAGLADGLSGNGKLILATVFATQPAVESVPWANGATRLLASGATDAEWNR